MMNAAEHLETKGYFECDGAVTDGECVIAEIIFLPGWTGAALGGDIGREDGENPGLPERRELRFRSANLMKERRMKKRRIRVHPCECKIGRPTYEFVKDGHGNRQVKETAAVMFMGAPFIREETFSLEPAIGALADSGEIFRKAFMKEAGTLALMPEKERLVIMNALNEICGCLEEGMSDLAKPVAERLHALDGMSIEEATETETLQERMRSWENLAWQSRIQDRKKADGMSAKRKQKNGIHM